MESSLESLQRFVGGQIKALTFASDCVAICNEDWRNLGMKKNMKFLGVEFGGPVAFVGTDGNGFAGLTEDQAQQIMRMVK